MMYLPCQWSPSSPSQISCQWLGHTCTTSTLGVSRYIIEHSCRESNLISNVKNLFQQFSSKILKWPLLPSTPNAVLPRWLVIRNSAIFICLWWKILCQLPIFPGVSLIHGYPIWTICFIWAATLKKITSMHNPKLNTKLQPLHHLC